MVIHPRTNFKKVNKTLILFHSQKMNKTVKNEIKKFNIFLFSIGPQYVVPGVTPWNDTLGKNTPQSEFILNIMTPPVIFQLSYNDSP